MYRYTKLPPNFVRVLELQPSNLPDAALSCVLTVQLIHDRPYEALSYVWGKPTLFHCDIECTDEDGAASGALAIGANLATALRAYRRKILPRRLWVDAICIRQEDLNERQEQVRLMGDIFRNATTVLCWLGAFENPRTDEWKAHAAIDFLRKFNEDQRGHLKQIQDYLRDGHLEGDDGTVPRNWSLLKEFFNLEYFHRAWIIQEVGLARIALLSWGHSQIYINWKEVAKFVLFLDDNGATVINHLQLKSWVVNHINLVWSNDVQGKPLYDFSEVLHWARTHASTDPRDYVFSLLGHPSALIDGVRVIDPNYVKTTSEVYTELVVNFVEKSKGLHVLAFVDHEETRSPLNVPTWVPDWHARNKVAPLRSPTKAADIKCDSARIDSSTSSATLCCRGYEIDAVAAFSETFNPRELTVSDRDTELAKEIPFLVDHLYRSLVLDIPEVSRPTAQYFISAVSSMVTGGYRDMMSAVSGENMKLLWADFAAYVVEFERIRTVDDGRGFLASVTHEESHMVEKLSEAGSANQFVQDMTWTSMCRKAFRTSNGHIGLGPRTMFLGDVCAVVEGSRYPLLLRPVGTQFELVGPILLYGFMDGEAKSAGLEAREFVLC